MLQETRDILDKIDDALAQQNEVSRQLWNVLSALRGPDDENEEVKENWTVPIRRAAFPKTAAIADRGFRSCVNGAKFQGADKVAVNDALRSELAHFHYHALDAVGALDIFNS